MTATNIATLGGGCFWCLDAALRQLRGVNSITSGYMGGSVGQPSYDQVCAGTTGHAEVVRVVFEPNMLNYVDLLQAFFAIHDPTTLNRQGHDIGSQYRSVVFTHSAEQTALASQLIAKLDAATLWPAPIVTEVIDASIGSVDGSAMAPSSDARLTFWPAEDYHQDYFSKNPHQGYCQAVVAPKVAKLRRQFADRLG